MQTRLSPRIATRTHRAFGPIHAVNQTAINVTDADAQFPLAKVVVLRVWRLESGQVQDALIDGSDGDVSAIARRDAINLNSHIQRPTRRGLGGGFHRRRQRTRARVDGGMGQAQSAGWVAASGHIHRAQHRCGDVNASTPFIGDGQRDHILTFLDLDRLH